MESADDMAIDSMHPVKLGLAKLRDSEGGENEGSMLLNKASHMLVPAKSQLNNKGKEVIGTGPTKEGEEDFEMGLVVVENKRRRPILELEENSESQSGASHSILSYNCRGLGQPRTVQVLTDLVKHKKPSFVFLMGTLCYRNQLEGLKNKLGFENLFVVDRVGRSAGMGQWRMTGYYGYPESARRRESWDLIRYLATISSLPWICLGDFNDLLFNYEKRGSRAHPNWKLRGFREAVDDADRAFANTAWCGLFPKAKVWSVEATCSDHLPIFVDPNPSGFTPRHPRFRFENVWLRESECEDVIQRSWSSSAGFPIQHKLAICGGDLSIWGGKLCRDFRKRIVECKHQMALLRGRRDQEGLEAFTEARKQYNELLHSHEVYWKQRAKSLWLKEGDMNSRFFHATTSKKMKKNTIEKLQNNQGMWCSNPSEIDALIIEYFQNLFSSGGCICELVLACVEARITPLHNQLLLEPFTALDVKEALFSTHLDNILLEILACGGEDVTEACLSYITNRAFPEKFNDTLIVLIPKHMQPEHLTDMRPIALCNVLYKIIAKMLANRMKLVLGEIIMLCVSTVSYRVIRNGIEVGPIVPSRGLRQGDSLSPYLFIICAEGLSSLIRNRERAGFIHGVKVARSAPAVSHLFFADDCFLFFKAHHNEARIMKSLLAVYGAASGQKVNLNKSSISFSANMDEDSISQELEIMMNSYWWGNKRNGGKSIHWLRWDSMCKPKSVGGIGFKKIHDFNIAMLGKQCWKLMTDPHSLVARILKARYYPRSSFTDASVGFNPSYTWRSLMAAKNFVVNGSRIQIGDGQQVQLSKDPWLPDVHNGFITSELDESLATATVDCLMVPGQRSWDYDLITDVFNSRDAGLILQVPLSARQNADRWYWLVDPKGQFTVRSCYELLNSETNVSSSKVWKHLWGLEIPGKVKHFF
ncbi:reverse transcriptase domain-containing protein [Citrus sinensis]|uniref:Reverse transcriptase domain-containing protein n=1 Tax=Citrus sinensis TaxID=2711 RepID=A0ACB8KJT2_CITSI|nr:reverse transcriptase domain-containing protein [Citrus sinensis]